MIQCSCIHPTCSLVVNYHGEATLEQVKREPPFHSFPISEIDGHRHEFKIIVKDFGKKKYGSPQLVK